MTEETYEYSDEKPEPVIKAKKAEKVNNLEDDSSAGNESHAGGTKMSEAQKKAKELATQAGEGAKKLGHGAAVISKAVWADPLLCVRWIDRQINRARDLMPPELFGSISSLFIKLGHVGLCVAVPVTLVFGVLSAMTKDATASAALIGLVAAVGLLAIQYSAHKFLNAGTTLIEASPTSLGSGAFLDCTALLSEVLGVFLLVGGIVVAINQKSLIPLGQGIALWVVCGAVTCVALHPSLINTSILKESSAGNEAIGIISFIAKTLMRLVPVVFGVGTAIWTVVLIFVTIGVPNNGADSIKSGWTAVQYIATSALLPFASYALFASYCLMIDLLKAILSLVDRK